ncbi:hypothetical protein TcWFU_008834 [Taenia crassiceps]|uniref:Secreted protein n=1 Tax=Taenia crassiceps TaxID=6207 RepID=A0ABR4QMH2_9CEST
MHSYGYVLESEDATAVWCCLSSTTLDITAAAAAAATATAEAATATELDLWCARAGSAYTLVCFHFAELCCCPGSEGPPFSNSDVLKLGRSGRVLRPPLSQVDSGPSSIESTTVASTARVTTWPPDRGCV